MTHERSNEKSRTTTTNDGRYNIVEDGSEFGETEDAPPTRNPLRSSRVGVPSDSYDSKVELHYDICFGIFCFSLGILAMVMIY